MRCTNVRWLSLVAMAVAVMTAPPCGRGTSSSIGFVSAQVPALPEGLDGGLEEETPAPTKKGKSTEETAEDGSSEDEGSVEGDLEGENGSDSGEEDGSGEGSGGTTTSIKAPKTKSRPKRDPKKPFIIEPKDEEESKEEMAGWEPVEIDSEIPKGYCFTEDLSPTECDSSFLSFTSFLDDGSSSFINTTATDGVVQASTGEFTKSALLGYALGEGSSSDFLLSTVARDKFLALNETSGDMVYVDKEHASKFTIFKRQQDDAMLIKTAGYFLSLGQSVSATVFVTSETFLLPAQTNRETVYQVVDQLDAEVLGYRAKALTAGGALSPMWFAYDFALVVPLNGTAKNAKFSKLTAKKVSFPALWDALRKSFTLIADKMLKEYSHFPFLGQDLPQELSFQRLAARVETVDKTVWSMVGTAFVESSALVPVTDDSPPSRHLAAMVFANAKFKERVQGGTLLSMETEKTETWMASYFRSSCALAWQVKGLSITEKLNRVEMLDSNKGLLTLEDPDNFQTYWFSNLINDTRTPTEGGPEQPMSPLNSSLLLVELGLMQSVDATFLAVNSFVGESISKPLFEKLDVVLNSGVGMDLDGVFRLVNDNSTKNALEAVDVVCSARLLELPVCVLPQIIRQAGIFSMYDRNVTSPKVITNLKNNAAIDRSAYLQLVQEDREAASLNEKLLEAKVAFVDVTKTLTDGLHSIVEDSVIQSALESSKQIAATTSKLTEYMTKSSKFKVNGLNADLTQKIRDIEAGQKKVADSQAAFLEMLSSIGDLAMIRAAIDAFVAVVETAFSALNVVDSFAKGGSGAIGEIGDLATDMEVSIRSINDAADTYKLMEYSDGLSKELGSVLSKMQAALPAINAVREASKPLTASQEMTTAQRGIVSQKFLEALRNYKAPVSVAELNSLQARFRAIGEKFCQVAEIPTKQECLDLPGQNMLIFTSLVENVRIGEEVLQDLMDMCTEAVNVRTLTVLSEKVKANEADATNFDDLKAKWGEDEKKKQTWWFRWRKEQQYLTAAATAGTVLQQVYLLSSIVEQCDEATYLNGGVPTPLCLSKVYSGKPIDDTSIDALIAAEEPTPGDEFIKHPLIPTLPSYPGDLAYIDLPKLMEGQPVYFKLPSDNATWLVEHKWIESDDELQSIVSYVTKFTVNLPPRFADYETEGATTEIMIESRQQSELGPALHGKTFLIKPVQFQSGYRLDNNLNEGSCEASYSCDAKIAQYCYDSDGSASIKDGLFPSMFTEWSIQARMPKPTEESARIGYSKALTPIMLRATVTVAQLNMNSERRERRNLRGLAQGTTAAATPEDDQPSTSDDDTSAAEPTECCTGKDEYLAFVDSDHTCQQCPKGTIPQLGGLYCAIDPRVTGKGKPSATTKSAADIEDVDTSETIEGDD